MWLCSQSAGRFDPDSETWQTAAVGGYTGCMADASEDGLLWMSTGQGVVGVNRDTLVVEKTWMAAGSYGISIDFEGYVWAVASGSTASKIDPVTGQFWTCSGRVARFAACFAHRFSTSWSGPATTRPSRPRRAACSRT